ncbi:hypothetical protein FR934_12350 [Synechocystis sp. PCC 6803]|jgi:hypothetical protein|uniref:hypothetical protein n=1 Tax=unclassified Synechocystis TaxID=2640012 RepID=UPI0002F7463B|nr:MULTISPECIES: hypothetical protein [unclassified Synechocystis]AVP91510.1 hypothetical protein C7I86_16810 [Synechocystis sp. IPPAS B-1465]MCW5241494.1 hypothetical protein [Synechocystis sp. PCC 6803]
MEKVVLKTTKQSQGNDFSYWQTQSYGKRLEALEQIRREYHQYKYNAEPRLQRIYRIVKQKSG